MAWGPADAGPVQRIGALLSCPCGPYVKGRSTYKSYFCDAGPAATWCSFITAGIFSIPVLLFVMPHMMRRDRLVRYDACFVYRVSGQDSDADAGEEHRWEFLGGVVALGTDDAQRWALGTVRSPLATKASSSTTLTPAQATIPATTGRGDSYADESVSAFSDAESERVPGSVSALEIIRVGDGTIRTVVSLEVCKDVPCAEYESAEEAETGAAKVLGVDTVRAWDPAGPCYVDPKSLEEPANENLDAWMTTQFGLNGTVTGLSARALPYATGVVYATPHLGTTGGWLAAVIVLLCLAFCAVLIAHGNQVYSGMSTTQAIHGLPLFESKMRGGSIGQRESGLPDDLFRSFHESFGGSGAEPFDHPMLRRLLIACELYARKHRPVTRIKTILESVIDRCGSSANNGDGDGDGGMGFGYSGDDANHVMRGHAYALLAQLAITDSPTLSWSVDTVGEESWLSAAAAELDGRTAIARVPPEFPDQLRCTAVAIGASQRYMSHVMIGMCMTGMRTPDLVRLAKDYADMDHGPGSNPHARARPPRPFLDGAAGGRTSTIPGLGVDDDARVTVVVDRKDHGVDESSRDTTTATTTTTTTTAASNNNNTTTTASSTTAHSDEPLRVKDIDDQ